MPILLYKNTVKFFFKLLSLNSNTGKKRFKITKKIEVSLKRKDLPFDPKNLKFLKYNQKVNNLNLPTPIVKVKGSPSSLLLSISKKVTFFYDLQKF